jgi:hydroxymethylglutaryl-CoA lyase
MKNIKTQIVFNILNRTMHTHSKRQSTPGYYLNRNPREKITPILFDVSLRDGIQCANPIDYPTERKLNILREICKKQSPLKIEIGSFVSPKVLPIMSDTEQLFNAIPTIFRNINTPIIRVPDIYALVPNKVGLLNAINCGFTNFSFITSVSNAFQLKNTSKNLLHKKTELQEMMNHISKLRIPAKTKLYVSCVNECPISGLIDNDVVIHEILSSYGRFDSEEYDEICVSDTMGTLKFRDFEYIICGLLRFGIAKSRISIHLHINKENEEEAKRILFTCFEKGIYRFDVSVISEGGCSVTMDSSKLKSNMSYEFFYSVLKDYESSS